MNTFHSERNNQMRRAIINAAMSAVLLAAPVAVLAAGGHGGMGGGMGGMGAMRQAPAISNSTTLHSSAIPGHTTGQPSQSCQAGANYPANTPGGSFNAPGSAFNPTGTAGNVYAGNPGTSSLNANNPKTVSQYDVACSH
jgi:hypothetical protein